MWCIPAEQDAAFVCQMESVLEVYRQPYAPRFPVVCMDEQPKQLIGHRCPAIRSVSGGLERVDYEYVRHGNCTVWMFSEPLAAWREVRVSERRTKQDWARQVRWVMEQERYQQAEVVTLVCDNLNTHTLTALYETFEPEEALQLARRLRLVYTPKHGSWLNMAEPELSVLTRQCLGTRIESQAVVEREVKAWTQRRNQQQVGVDWQFRTEDARIKLRRLYPKIKS